VFHQPQLIALLIASLVVIYLVREVDDADQGTSFDPQATISNE